MRLNGVKWPTKEALLRSAGSLEYGLSFMFLPPVVLTGPTRPGYLPLLGAYKRSYSPKCVEYVFSEVHIQHASKYGQHQGEQRYRLGVSMQNVLPTDHAFGRSASAFGLPSW